jgi:hypothetical protein
MPMHPYAQAMLITFIADSGSRCSVQLAPPSCVPNTCPRRAQKYTCSGCRALIATPNV